MFFRPDADLFDGLLLQPRPSSLPGDPLGELCEAAAARGMQTNAWTVFLHSDSLGFEHPGCATQNAFGDRYLTDLCPANPDVRAFATALTSNLARYGVSNIFAESLHYHGLGHGYHHERYFEDLGPVGTFLLGLCFCEHCLAAADRDGIDGEAVRRSTRAELLLRFEQEVDDGPGELTRERLEPFGGEELLAYLDCRTSMVTSLAQEVSAAAGEATSLVFLDVSGAEKGFATGEPKGGPAASDRLADGARLARARAELRRRGGPGIRYGPGQGRLGPRRLSVASSTTRPGWVCCCVPCPRTTVPSRTSRQRWRWREMPASGGWTSTTTGSAA